MRDCGVILSPTQLIINDVKLGNQTQRSDAILRHHHTQINLSFICKSHQILYFQIPSLPII